MYNRKRFKKKCEIENLYYLSLFEICVCVCVISKKNRENDFLNFFWIFEFFFMDVALLRERNCGG